MDDRLGCSTGLSAETGPIVFPTGYHHNDPRRVNLNRQVHRTPRVFQLAGLVLLVEDHALNTYNERMERNRRRVAP